jgi:hypothetical protein
MAGEDAADFALRPCRAWLFPALELGFFVREPSQTAERMVKLSPRRRHALSQLCSAFSTVTALR